MRHAPTPAGGCGRRGPRFGSWLGSRLKSRCAMPVVTIEDIVEIIERSAPARCRSPPFFAHGAAAPSTLR